jgi:prepilin-type N-terminal cleavage/methylation domain-containing protein
MRRIDTLTSARGVTLIEVVAALGIIAVGLVGLLALFPAAIQEGTRAGDRSTASVLGDYVVNEVHLREKQIQPGDNTAQALTALGWDDYAYWGRQHTFNADNPSSKNFGSGEQIVKQDATKLTDREQYSRYEVTLRFEDVPGFAAGALKRLTVTLRWPRAFTSNDRERQNKMTFVTYVRPQWP